MAHAYGVRTIIDLRSDRERQADGPVPPDLDVVPVSLFDDFDTDAAYRAGLGVRLSRADVPAQYRALYAEALIRNADEFGEALTAVAEARKGGVIIHCVGGKDRTGVLAALLLRLADVPIPAVAADYERSAQRLGVADSAPAGVIDEVIARVEQRHGSVERYFAHVGVGVGDISRVRQRLVDE